MGPFRVRIAGIAGLVIGLLAASPALAQDLLPDMQTRPLPTTSGGIQVIGPSGAKQLAFTNAWANHGAGPWETAPDLAAPPADCDGDGNAANDVVVDQIVYQDSNANGIFERGVDTGTNSREAGCMVFHVAHDHFHIEDAGHYSLLSDPAGTPAGDSVKVSFCLLDTGGFDLTLPGAPQSPYYQSCNQDFQGISVGWYDQYGRSLPGQQIDLGGVGAGNYCLRSEFDPEGLFTELDETNNVAEQRYFIDPAANQVTPLPGACLAPLPPSSDTVLDGEAPNTRITRGPNGETEDRTPRFRFRAGEPATFECKLDRRRWRPCESPRSYGRRALGRHRFKVRATDTAGNREPEPAKKRFEIVAKD